MPHGLECLIVADDLTGACDAAAPFAARGLAAAVPLAGAESGGARVVAISTGTRDAAPDEIRRRMADAAALWGGRQPRLIFKKIDSTLRGQAGVEIAAALEAFGRQAALLAPAFPGMNRVVEAGWLRVAGAEDFAPIEIVPYLRAQGLEGCARVRAETIAEGLDSGARILALDAACDADLDALVAAGMALGQRILWAGSAGLAAALARSPWQGGIPPQADLPAARNWQHGQVVLPERLAGPADEPRWAAPQGPVLFAIGSDHPATLAQEEALLACRAARRVESRREIRETLERGRHALLRIARGRLGAAELWELLAGAPAAALLLSGGDTAALVCQAARVERIELHDEILPGIPAGVLRGGGFDGVAVATKSGGFGGEDALMQVADYFTCPNR